MSEKEERGEERTEKLHETWRGWREQRQRKMGVKRESEMILVKEEESEIRRGTKREKMEAKNKWEKTEGRGRMSFFPRPTFCFCACAGGEVSILIWPSASAQNSLVDC